MISACSFDVLYALHVIHIVLSLVKVSCWAAFHRFAQDLSVSFLAVLTQVVESTLSFTCKNLVSSESGLGRVAFDVSAELVTTICPFNFEELLL